MEDKYYKFRTEEDMNNIINTIEKEGYNRIGIERATFEEIKKGFPRNKIYVINCFYNYINNKLEYTFTTTQILKTYGRDKIKFSN